MATFTVGKTTAGSTSSASSTDKLGVSQFTASSGNSGTLTSGGTHLWLSATGSTATKMVVYADSSGTPGSKLAESAEVVVTQTTDSEVGYTFSGANQITITDGVTYWIGVYWQDPGTPSVNIGRDNTILSTATPPGRYEGSGAGVVYPTVPNPFGTATAQSGPMATYITVTYTPSGGGGGTVTPTIRGVSTGSDAGSASTSHTVSTPSGLTAGDYLLVFASGDADSVLANRSTTLSGLTTITSRANDSANNIPSCIVYGKVATSGDASAGSWTFSDSSPADCSTVIMAITVGTFDTTTPVTIGTWTTQVRPPGTQPQNAASMTGVASALLLALFVSDTNGVVQTYPTTGPTGMTRQANIQSQEPAGPYSLTGVYSQVLSAAGATGTKSVTPTPSVSTNGWSTLQLMVNPGTAAGGATSTTDFFMTQAV